MRRSALAFLALALSACPTQNSLPCAKDAECPSTLRCRSGACGPICLDDSECGTAQVCQGGTCQPRPECVKTEDCATGFSCTAGKCACTGDSACLANQTCLNGQCMTRKPCTANADCAGSGGRCELTQGQCLPVCRLGSDCAPMLDPRVALAIYSCLMGTCTRRCLNDQTCGMSGLICQGGLCEAAQCKTMSDCPMNQYCTSANFGRCAEYTVCTSSDQCDKDHECLKFPSGQCPPGFDCSKSICQERQRCVIDGDCVPAATTANPMPAQNGYCSGNHCRPAVKCSGASCAAGFECVASLCVPAACRGHADCTGGQFCVEGKCASPPPDMEYSILQLTPLHAVLEVGDVLQLHLVGFGLGGVSSPVPSAKYDVLDDQGQPSSLATVTTGGLVTAVGPGTVKIRASVTASGAPPKDMVLAIYPHVTSGRRVLVLRDSTHQGLSGVAVKACLASDCSAPLEATTDAMGVASFPALGAGAMHAVAISPAVRTGDGLPLLERATALSVETADLVLPLRENPVHAAAGFNATIEFGSVHSSGTYWVGLGASSIGDLPEVKLAEILGETFQVEIPGVGQKVPVPGAVVLYTSPGFGIPQEVKGKSLGLGQAGEVRGGVAFAGRGELDQAALLRSTQLLGYVGAFDYAVVPPYSIASLSRVADTADVDNDGLCSNAGRCPMGSEEVPDYAQFPMLNFAPQREQQRRSEIVLPKLPSTADQVVVAAVETTSEGGALPLGFSAVTPGPPAGDGTRTAAPFVLRSGAPYFGVEVSTPGVWVLAGNNAGTLVTSRLTRGPTLPARILVAPMIPGPGAGSYAAATRTFGPSQPDWASAYSSGGELARVTITGSQNRHVVYLPMVAGQGTFALPQSPAGPGTDPLGEGMPSLDVVAFDLVGSSSADDAFDLAGAHLDTLISVVDGYSKSSK
ncbi:MAG: hypothetical protein K1X89_08715 [Myxococcaceae bacterium]|nr:hypothetical protein [Myxococcaceae bacterium]